MKVFLINPDYMIYPFPPLGLCYLASYVKKYLPYVDIKILDQLNSAEIIRKIKKEKPLIIGLSSTSPHHWKVKKLAMEIKKHSKAVLVLGGIHVTNLQSSFEKSPFDIGIIGEGEITFKKFLESIYKNKGINLNDLKGIKGFLLRQDNKVITTGLGERVQNLDDIPIPARNLLNMDYYTLPSFSDPETFEPTGLLLTSRGCPYNCTFCSSTKFWGNVIKFFSAERVVKEIEILYYKYDYKKIMIYDDLFTMNKPRIEKIIELLKKKNLLGKIEFGIMARGNCFNEDIVKLLKKMNVTMASFGIETGSKRMLPKLKNNILLEDDINAIELCRKYDIKPLGAFMIGMPEEKEEDMIDTYTFIKTYLQGDEFVFAQMAPLPNTPVWFYSLKNNLANKDMYEKENRRFLEFNKKHLLSLEVSQDIFEKYYFMLESLKFKKRFSTKKMMTLRPKHVIKLFSPLFIKKLYNLGIKGVKQG